MGTEWEEQDWTVSPKKCRAKNRVLAVWPGTDERFTESGAEDVGEGQDSLLTFIIE